MVTKAQKHPNTIISLKVKIIPKIKLVKDIVIMVKVTSLAAALIRSKRQPTCFMWHRMDESFTEDMLCNSFRGKKSLYLTLDQDTMMAILY